MFGTVAVGVVVAVEVDEFVGVPVGVPVEVLVPVLVGVPGAGVFVGVRVGVEVEVLVPVLVGVPGIEVGVGEAATWGTTANWRVHPRKIDIPRKAVAVNPVATLLHEVIVQSSVKKFQLVITGITVKAPAAYNLYHIVTPFSSD